MPRLAANIFHDGDFYGPGFGNADRVPPEVAAAHPDPGLWVDGQSPVTHGNVEAIPADVEDTLDALSIEDRFPGVPTYEEARARHDAEQAADSIDVDSLKVPELRRLLDEHAIGWVHRDPKPVLIDKLRNAGVTE